MGIDAISSAVAGNGSTDNLTVDSADSDSERSIQGASVDPAKDHWIANGHGQAAAAPLYATLFPAAGAWNQAAAWFGEAMTEIEEALGNPLLQLAAALPLFFRPSLPPLPLFTGGSEFQQLAQPWIPGHPAAQRVLYGALRRYVEDHPGVSALDSLREIYAESKTSTFNIGIHEDTERSRILEAAYHSAHPTAVFFAHLIAVHNEWGPIHVEISRGVSSPDLAKLRTALKGIFALQGREWTPYRLWLAEKLHGDMQPGPAHAELRSLVVPFLIRAYAEELGRPDLSQSPVDRGGVKTALDAAIEAYRAVLITKVERTLGSEDCRAIGEVIAEIDPVAEAIKPLAMPNAAYLAHALDDLMGQRTLLESRLLAEAAAGLAQLDRTETPAIERYRLYREIGDRFKRAERPRDAVLADLAGAHFLEALSSAERREAGMERLWVSPLFYGERVVRLVRLKDFVTAAGVLERDLFFLADKPQSPGSMAQSYDQVAQALSPQELLQLFRHVMSPENRRSALLLKAWCDQRSGRTSQALLSLQVAQDLDLVGGAAGKAEKAEGIRIQEEIFHLGVELTRPERAAVDAEIAPWRAALFLGVRRTDIAAEKAAPERRATGVDIVLRPAHVQAALARPALFGRLYGVLLCGNGDMIRGVLYKKLRDALQAHPGLGEDLLTDQIGKLGVDREAFLKTLAEKGQTWSPEQIAFELAAATLQPATIISAEFRDQVVRDMEKAVRGPDELRRGAGREGKEDPKEGPRIKGPGGK